MNDMVWHQKSKKLWTLYRASGKDIADFFNRISTASIHQLSDCSGTDAFFLTPTGKILCFFSIWKQASNEFLIEVYDDSLKNASFFEFVEKFHFGEKFSIEPLPYLLSVESPTDIMQQHLLIQKDTFIMHCTQKAYTPAMQRIWNPSSTADVSAVTDEIFIEYLVDNMLPLPSELHEGNPLEFGFKELFTTPKGCYPGQEVIERTLSRSEPAKRFVQINQNNFELQDDILVNNKKVSFVTSTSRKFIRALIPKMYSKINQDFEIKNKKAYIQKISAW